MLQKGFLTSREAEENTRAVKRSRMFLIVGVLMILGGFFLLLGQMKHGQEELSIAWLILVVTGFCLISVSMWMNFFRQKKNRRR